MSIRRILLGPEIYWGFVYLIVSLVASRNVPPTESFSASLESLWYAVPVFGIPLSFVFVAIHRQRRGWLLARTNLACLIGLFFTALRVTNAIDYQDSRNSGVLAGFVISLGLGVIVLVFMNLVAIVFLILARRKGASSNADC
ncbi:MAG: hypothetical protein K1Y02_20290 [Candidatus Hydrogenedentes bacterium]|nr:hypothetical protein [Candidatus Hydrogenedentota bacterium]